MSGKGELRFEHVRDDECRKMFEAEAENLKTLRELRGQIKAVRDEKDALRASSDPERERTMAAFDEKLEKLFSEKDKLHRSGAASTAEQLKRLERGKEMDRRQNLIRNQRPLLDQIQNLGYAVEDFTRKAGVLNAEIKNHKDRLPKASHKALKAELAEAEEALKKARSSKVEANIAKCGKERNAIQTQVTAHERVEKLQKDFLEAVTGAKESGVLHKKKQEEKDAAEVEIERLNKKLQLGKDYALSPEERKKQKDAKDKEFEDRKKKVDAKMAEITKVKEQRRLASENPEQKKLSAKIDEINEQIKAIDAKKEAAMASIPSTTVAIEPGYVQELVGKGGTNLQQIETDFGVVIDVRREDNKAIIRGTEHEACAETVRAMLEGAKANRHEEAMTIDKDLSFEFIGKGGEQIQSFEAASGASIDFNKETGDIIVIGNETAVTTCVELINNFKANSFKVVLKFDRKVDTFLRPNLMRQWQEEYSVPSVRCDRAAQTITLRGREDLVEKAKESIASFLEDAVTIPIPSNVSHFAIIGSKGSVVNNIQSATETLLDVSEHRVMIAGTKDRVAKAKELVDALIRENITEQIKIPYPANLHNYLTRRRPVAKKPEDETPAAEEDKEKHADPAATEGEAADAAAADAAPAKPAAPVDDACILEALRRQHGLFIARADMMAKVILCKGPRDGVARFERDVKAAMRFTGMQRELMTLKEHEVRYLTVNTAARGVRGVRTRLDALRAIEGVEEIVADHRAESLKVQVIGTEEGVKAGKAAIEEVLAELEAKSHTFEVEAGKIGRLLGPRGATAADIEEQFGVKLFIPRDTRSKGRTEPVPIIVVVTDLKEGEEPMPRLLDAEKAAMSELAL